MFRARPFHGVAGQAAMLNSRRKIVPWEHDGGKPSLMRERAVANIHPTAVVDPSAEIASDVVIGPFCVIESGVSIQESCQLASRVSVKTGTQLGTGNIISEGATIGGRPQHLKAGQRVGRLLIGNGNQIRENVTIHVGLDEQHDTIIGNHNLIMVNTHVGHDCRIANNTILANNVMLSGHVTIQNRAYLSGAVGIHQFCRVGELAMVGGQAHINRDIPPFVTIDGVSSEVVGLNTIGLRRNGCSSEDLVDLKAAYRVIYRSNLRWSEVIEALKDSFTTGPAAQFHEFLSTGKRGFVQERRTSSKATLKLFPVAKEEVNEKQPIRHAS